MRGESKISHVVQNEQIFLMFFERLHQGRHAEIKLSASMDVPGRRVHAIGFEEGHEPQGWLLRWIAPDGSFHEVQPGQRQQCSGCAS